MLTSWEICYIANMNTAIYNKLRILSRSEEPFLDRIEAGALLGEALIRFKGPQAMVLGIPRGGLVVARQAARGLQVPLDIVLSRKLGAPLDPELAIGSITENGEVFVDQGLVRRLGVDEKYVQDEWQRQLVEIRRRQRIYRQKCFKTVLRNKDIILIDDGVATGATVQAALWSIRQENPHRIIVAIPVGSEETLLNLCEAADEVICLKSPLLLQGVGRFYLDFEQVSEEEVLDILKECAG
jgi:predicted phosphoribosyltransferase